MSTLKTRKKEFSELGMKPLNGQIKVVKDFNIIQFTSLSIHLDNIFLEDIDFVISELNFHKDELKNDMIKSINIIKNL